MVYVAAHVGFAGAMLNPFTIGIAQDMAGLPLFSGIEYRVFCWVVLMMITIAFVLWYASKTKKRNTSEDFSQKNDEVAKADDSLPKRNAWISFAVLSVVTILFSGFYASDCSIKLGQAVYDAPWLMWVIELIFIISSVLSLRCSVRMYILGLLMFTIVYMVIGVMGYGWYLPEICALFMALGVAAGFSAGYSASNCWNSPNARPQV